MIRMIETTPSVVKSRLESSDAKAPKRSPKIPPGPVTYGVSPCAFAIGATSSRSACTTAGRTGLSFGRIFERDSPSSGMLTKIAFPSCEGNAVTWLPFRR